MRSWTAHILAEGMGARAPTSGSAWSWERRDGLRRGFARAHRDHLTVPGATATVPVATRASCRGAVGHKARASADVRRHQAPRRTSRRRPGWSFATWGRSRAPRARQRLVAARTRNAARPSGTCTTGCSNSWSRSTLGRRMGVQRRRPSSSPDSGSSTRASEALDDLRDLARDLPAAARGQGLRGAGGGAAGAGARVGRHRRDRTLRAAGRGRHHFCLGRQQRREACRASSAPLRSNSGTGICASPRSMMAPGSTNATGYGMVCREWPTADAIGGPCR